MDSDEEAAVPPMWTEGEALYMKRAFQLANTALMQTADWEVATPERLKALVAVYKAKRSTMLEGYNSVEARVWKEASATARQRPLAAAAVVGG